MISQRLQVLGGVDYCVKDARVAAAREDAHDAGGLAQF